MKTFKISTQKVKRAEIVKDNRSNDFYISADVNNGRYIAEFIIINNIIAVTCARELSATKQTTARIKYAIENYLN